VPNVGFPFGWNVNIGSGTTPSQPRGNNISGEPMPLWLANLSTVHHTLCMHLFLVNLLSLGALLLVACMVLEGAILMVQPMSMGVLLLQACMVLELAMFWEALLSWSSTTWGTNSTKNYHMGGLPSPFGSHNVTPSPQKSIFQHVISFIGDIRLT
jgi:hypothetical protein